MFQVLRFYIYYNFFQQLLLESKHIIKQKTETTPHTLHRLSYKLKIPNIATFSREKCWTENKKRFGFCQISNCKELLRETVVTLFNLSRSFLVGSIFHYHGRSPNFLSSVLDFKCQG